MLAAERAKTREELLQATETELSKIVAATTRQKKRLTGAANIALKVGKVVNLYKVAKHFTLDIQENSFSYEKNTQSINNEAALDGLYVIRMQGTIAHNEIVGTIEGASWVFDKITQPTIVQQKALDLLGVSLICTQ